MVFRGSAGREPGKPAKVCCCGLPAQRSRGSAGENITPLHRRGSSQPREARAKTLGQESHNPLVRVTDEGRDPRSIAGAVGAVLIQGAVF